jgi:hypothetical protein
LVGEGLAPPEVFEFIEYSYSNKTDHTTNAKGQYYESIAEAKG